MDSSNDKKWTSTAGPIQTKKVNEALKAISQEGQTHRELSGVKNADGTGGTANSFWSPFGGTREDAKKALNEIAERFNWTVTRENHAQIIVAAQEAVAELFKTRPTTDNRRTIEEEEKLRADIDAAEQERREADRKKAAERDELIPKLRAQYPWAVSKDGRLSEHARAAQNLRTEFSRTFPGIEFSVQSEHGRISLRWTLGPSDKSVKELVHKYQNSWYEHDGGDGTTRYDHSALGEAISAVLGRVSYVSESRTIPQDVQNQVAKLLCELQHQEWDGNFRRRGLVGEMDTYDISDHMHQVVHRTDFPAGSKIKGIESTGQKWTLFYEEMFAKYGEGWAMDSRRAELSVEDRTKLEALQAEDRDKDPSEWCRLILELPDVSKAAQDAQPMTIDASGIIIRRNLAKDGVEIRFESKPAQTVLDQLKANGWRWARFSKCWYSRWSNANWEFVHKLTGLPVPEIKEEHPDRFDMGVEDQMREACGC